MAGQRPLMWLLLEWGRAACGRVRLRAGSGPANWLVGGLVDDFDGGKRRLLRLLGASSKHCRDELLLGGGYGLRERRCG